MTSRFLWNWYIDFTFSEEWRSQWDMFELKCWNSRLNTVNLKYPVAALAGLAQWTQCQL